MIVLHTEYLKIEAVEAADETGMIVTVTEEAAGEPTVLFYPWRGGVFAMRRDQTVGRQVEGTNDYILPRDPAAMKAALIAKHDDY